MSLLRGIADGWRKNAPELLGLFNGALPSFVWSRRPPDRLDGIPVFSYHVVDRADFEADCEFLSRNGYRTLFPDDLLEFVSGHRRPGGRELVLTFDDGPRNFFDVALPLLRRHGLCGTVFIAPGLHAEDYGEFQDLVLRPMTWSEIRSAQASGQVSVQSHTLQSQYLPRWPAPAPLAGVDPRIEARLRRVPLAVSEDFRAAKALIEARCPGAIVRHLCYPMYLATDEALAALQRCGYVAGYGGLRPGQPLVKAGADLRVLPRLSGEFLQRLPGDGRVRRSAMLSRRVADAGRARQRRRRTGEWRT